MKKVTTEQLSRPESELDPEVIAFRKQFDAVSPLDEIVRKGELLSNVVFSGTELGGFLHDSVGEFYSLNEWDDFLVTVEPSPSFLG